MVWPYLTAGLIILDQLTKAWASHRLQNEDLVLIPEFLSFHYTENPGAAFSFWQGMSMGHFS